MNKQRVFVTGGAGFLGASIIRQLLSDGCEVMAAKRTQTNTFRCKDFFDKVIWVDTMSSSYQQTVIDFNPDVIIHAAWAGVSSKERADWGIQMSNFQMLADILKISEQTLVKKIIILGSQAEYGAIAETVDENYPVMPNDAYATCKLASQKIIETFCGQKGIDWYWLRVFSVFGPTEAGNWFIPWVIGNQLKNTDIDLTGCEQEYDYLFIDDFAVMVSNMVNVSKSIPGIYNICSGKTVKLKTITEIICKCIGGKGKLNYGTIPYRPNQSMKISGDNSKYNVTFGKIKVTDIDYAIKQTISYYKERDISNNTAK
jgi:nucleoside-diphosphate-sugar epimerase